LISRPLEALLRRIEGRRQGHAFALFAAALALQAILLALLLSALVRRA
jgi:hypothetical protein